MVAGIEPPPPPSLCLSQERRLWGGGSVTPATIALGEVTNKSWSTRDLAGVVAVAGEPLVYNIESNLETLVHTDSSDLWRRFLAIKAMDPHGDLHKDRIV
ncbi:hypothetical protein CRG98_018710 [Punica granatum]|uniref:Uncharacterized protein n=1 Tax=Punica granatum TaxID=22663 RepID=A0A2I0JX67_PUNGR|nr:hypothetical protein CRG98_018710 [Punica granatum]